MTEEGKKVNWSGFNLFKNSVWFLDVKAHLLFYFSTSNFFFYFIVIDLIFLLHSIRFYFYFYFLIPNYFYFPIPCFYVFFTFFMLSFKDIDFIPLFYSFSACSCPYFCFVTSIGPFVYNSYMLLDTYYKLGR